MKAIFLLLINFLFFCGLNACSSKTSSLTPTSPATRDGFYSNTFLWPSYAKAHFTLPLTASLVTNIRQAGGEVYQTGSFVTLVLPADTLFEPTTANLLPHGERLLLDVAKIIARFPEDNVIITMHTDSVGDSRFQANITRQQAQLVAIFLWQQDEIDLKTFQRFKYAGMGGTQPVTDNPSSLGAALNRRLQVTIYPTKSTEAAYKTVGSPDFYQI